MWVMVRISMPSDLRLGRMRVCRRPSSKNFFFMRATVCRESPTWSPICWVVAVGCSTSAL